MNVVAYADAPTLWREAETFLSRDPANNRHQLSSIKRILDLGSRGGERFPVYTPPELRGRGYA